MDTVARLPLPSLAGGRFASGDEEPVAALTDEALFASCGVRIAFTERFGGFSAAPYDSLNLGTRVGDDPACVVRNRRKLLAALGGSCAELVSPRQVHGTTVVRVGAHASLDEMEAARELAEAGADAVVTARANLAALLCFADCVPVIAVAPRGAFAVVHAGWRGVYAHIVREALAALAAESGCAPGECNVYIGPYLHAECFEVSADLARKFQVAFGEEVLADERHVDMGAALRADLLADGVDPERIADAGVCTACTVRRFFSYRKQAGICGRMAAVALRIPRDGTEDVQLPLF